MGSMGQTPVRLKEEKCLCRSTEFSVYAIKTKSHQIYIYWPIALVFELHGIVKDTCYVLMGKVFNGSREENQ